MTTVSACRWFYSQPVASLTNPLSRLALAELLADPANALVIMRQRYPLRQANAIQYAALIAAYSGNSELLARLPIDWSNRLELAGLSTVLTTSYPGAIMAGVPLLYYQFNELFSPVINYGSLDTTLNGTVANMGAFQASGPSTTVPYAYTFNGTTSIVTIPSSSGAGSTNWTIAILINPASAGEAGFGRLFELLTTAGTAAALLTFEVDVDHLSVIVNNTSGTGFTTTTNTNGPGTGTWLWVFIQYNDTTKNCTLWRSVSRVLTAFGTGTAQTLTGTARQIGQGFIGNNAATTRAYDGKYAQFALYPALLTTTQMQNIITASGI